MASVRDKWQVYEISGKCTRIISLSSSHDDVT